MAAKLKRVNFQGQSFLIPASGKLDKAGIKWNIDKWLKEGKPKLAHAYALFWHGRPLDIVGVDFHAGQEFTRGLLKRTTPQRVAEQQRKSTSQSPQARNESKSPKDRQVAAERSAKARAWLAARKGLTTEGLREAGLEPEGESDPGFWDEVLTGAKFMGEKLAQVGRKAIDYPAILAARRRDRFRRQGKIISRGITAPTSRNKWE